MNIRGFDASGLPRFPEGIVVLDPAQRQVLALPHDVSAVVIGPPGSGKTTTMIELIADRIHNHGWSPEEVLVLSPTRGAATQLRDRLATRLAVPTLGPLARTANSLAFQLVRNAANAAGLPAPKLLTGAEQDQIIATLIDGGIADGSGPSWPDQLAPEVRRLRGFRTELRDLMMRAVEYGLIPGDLARLGAVHGKPEWGAAAAFIAEYEQVVALYRDRYFDSAELVREAAETLNNAAERSILGNLSGLRLIMLDDAQEITQSTVSLLRAFASRGIQVIAFGDPDITTGSFRGAKPEVLGRLASSLGIASAQSLVLNTIYRHGAEISSVVSAVVQHIGTAGVALHRKPAHVKPPELPAIVRRVEATSAAQEVAIIARRLRELNVFDSVPWSQMAVIVRNSSLIAKFARGLTSFEVPTAASGSGTALRDEFAVKALILLIEVGLGRKPLTADTAVELLTGPLGSLDAVSLRRLTSALRHRELATGGIRSGGQLLAECLTQPGTLAMIDTSVARQAARVAASLASVKAESVAGATIEELLWGVWRRSGLDRKWYGQALGTGIVAEEANRALDSVVGLFAAAKRFVERTPEFSPHNFLDEWVGAEVPEDSLAPRAAFDAVVVGTPNAVIGQEFSVVVVAGVQEHVWPNTRVRGSLLGSNELGELLSGRAAPAGNARASVIHDELRMFAQAASRAKQELMVTAVANDDTLPSPFFGLVPPGPPLTGSRHPLSLRGLVGKLRHELVAAIDVDPRAALDAASALAQLAREGISGAAPDQWYGMRPLSTRAPRCDIAAGEKVAVSPSRMLSFETCGLHWLIEQIGGGGSNLASNLGTLVHHVAEQATDISASALWREMAVRWGEFEFESEWQSEVQKGIAQDMAQRLSAYLTDFQRSGGELLKAELSFELPIGDALLRGTIDRVERTSRGAVVIVDLKTGKKDPTSAAGVADHPQLGAYQLAFASGAIEGVDPAMPSDGAKLVIVSRGTQKKPYYDPQQPAFTAEELETFRQRVQRDATGMAGSVFIAHVAEHCLDPWAFGSCRIHVVRAVSA